MMSVSTNALEDQELLDRAKALVKAMESADVEAVEKIIHELAGLNETSLYRQIGTLTRELHDAVNAFCMELQANDITEADIPDARDRLKYVVDLTEKSAEKTLAAIEEGVPRARQIGDQATVLTERWHAFYNRRIPLSEFRELCEDISEYLEFSRNSAVRLHGGLSTILMAQDFQDITGQIIQRVIKLIDDVEHRLITILSLSGVRRPDKSVSKDNKNTILATGGPIIPGQATDGIAKNQDEVDQLLTSLGF